MGLGGKVGEGKGRRERMGGGGGRKRWGVWFSGGKGATGLGSGGREGWFWRARGGGEVGGGRKR